MGSSPTSGMHCAFGNNWRIPHWKLPNLNSELSEAPVDSTRTMPQNGHECWPVSISRPREEALRNMHKPASGMAAQDPTGPLA